MAKAKIQKPSKPFRGWAVFGTYGHIHLWTISGTAKDAAYHEDSLFALTVQQVREKGCTVRRVVVVEETK
jgi:hypothetical protein